MRLWLLCLSTAFAFEVEPWLTNLSLYGPLDGSTNWEAHPMRLVGDYVYTLDYFSARGGDEFLFVSVLNSTPPLGSFNWKQGKLGVWNSGRLEPGGGSGRYPVTGTYSISLSTPQSPFTPSTFNLILIEAQAVSVNIKGSSFLNFNNSMTLAITFHEAVSGLELSDVQAASSVGSVTLSDLTDHGLALDGSHSFSVIAHPTKNGLIKISIAGGVTNSTAGPSEPASWSFLHKPLIDKGVWTQSIMLRDSSGTYRPESEPPGGWHVTPIHIVMLPTTGHLLVSGWLRRDELPCMGGPMAGGRRQASVSFILNPETLPGRSDYFNITRVDEHAQYAFGELHTNLTNEGHPIDGDAIYCAGHTTLRDGRVFYAGGARYSYVSSPYEHEYGLDYARLFDPKTNTFTRINWTMPLGRAWYPTCALLPDGRVLVSGGYSDYATDNCTGFACLNPQMNIFDPVAYDQGRNPWQVYINTTYMTHDIDPGVREYTRIFVLPEPVLRSGHMREVLVMGKAGVVYLLAMNEKVQMNERMYKPSGGMRPNNCSDQSTAVPLLSNGGELMVIGGCSGDILQRIDIYNVQKDTWESFDTGIVRAVPSAFLLADGNVLITSGENTQIQQSEYENEDAAQDPRFAQIFNPETRQISTSESRATRFRGYHNTGALLKDGSVLIGGGFDQHGDVGCENTDVQIYKPSYLFSGPRPLYRILSLTTIRTLELNKEIAIDYDSNSVTSVVKVSLLATQAFTHSYGQHQRHVNVPIVKSRSGVVTVQFPDSPRLFPGMYLMFLISDQGVPSVGLPVQVVLSGSAEDGPSVSDYVWLVVLSLVLVIMLAAFVCKPIRQRCCAPRLKGEEILPYTPMTESILTSPVDPTPYAPMSETLPSSTGIQ